MALDEVIWNLDATVQQEDAAARLKGKIEAAIHHCRRPIGPDTTILLKPDYAYREFANPL